MARSLTRDGETVIAFPSFRFGWALFLVPVFLTFAAVLWLLGSRNPYTPAGYVGYLTKGAVFGQARFYGVCSADRSRRAAAGCSRSRTSA